MKPQVVVFDLGKVLVEFDWTKAARNFAKHSVMNAEEIYKLLLHTPPLFKYETGLLSNEEFVAEVSSSIGFRKGRDEFERLFSDIFEPINGMIDAHASLRDKGIPTFIFSNTNDFAVKHIRKHYPFFNNFDGYILSYEHRSMKPDAKLYEVVEKTTGRRNGEIIYVDDRKENVDAGAARGWQTVLHETPELSRAALKKAGLLE